MKRERAWKGRGGGGHGSNDEIFDIVKELSEDPIFLSLSCDLMYSTATKKVVLMRYLIEIQPIWLPKLE